MTRRATFALALAAISIFAAEAPPALRAQSVPAQSAETVAVAPRVFRVPPTTLAALRDRIAAGNFSDPALDQLRADADHALTQPPLSITDKPATPPSGDKHDYMSQAPYFWPNPDTSNGLPYIRRDGERKRGNTLRRSGERQRGIPSRSAAWLIPQAIRDEPDHPVRLAVLDGRAVDDHADRVHEPEQVRGAGVSAHLAGLLRPAEQGSR